jgi:hypothetical protein
MSAPIYYLTSFLEDATLSQSGEGEASGFPLLCVEDRDEGAVWKGTATSGTRRLIGTKAGSTAVATMILGEGHGFTGLALTLESSPDGANWTSRATPTPSDGHRAAFAVTDTTALWWRLSWATGGLAYLGELYLTKGATPSKVPTQAGTVLAPVTPVDLQPTRSGRMLLAKLGLQRWGMAYVYTRVSDADRLILAAVEALGKPFYLADHTGTLRLVYLTAPPSYAREFGAVDVWTVTITLAEVEALA